MSEEGFLSRWSRRKRAADAGRLAPEPDQPPATTPPAEAQPPEPAVAEAPPEAEPEFDPSTLPPVETLTSGSDFTAFLRKEVPEGLRRAALRRAWTLDPAIRDFVGLADYDWDFNAPDGITGFALELGEDAGRLLAQAVGLDRHAPPSQDNPPGSDTGHEQEAPPPAPAAEALHPLIAEAPTPEPGCQPAPEPGPAPRRHGSALPS